MQQHISLCHAAFWMEQYFWEEVRSWEARPQLIAPTSRWELRWVAWRTFTSTTWQIRCRIPTCAERTEFSLAGLSKVNCSFWCILVFRPFDQYYVPTKKLPSNPKSLRQTHEEAAHALSGDNWSQHVIVLRKKKGGKLTSGSSLALSCAVMQ